jgi:4-hydroxy-tetrahydrodipicolinate reductase
VSEAPALRVAIAGASGRMGRMLVEAVLDAPDLCLAAALEHSESPALGQDAADQFGKRSGVLISADIAGALMNAQVLIDFTRPEGTLTHLRACVASGTRLVIGTTGFTDSQKAEIVELSSRVAVVMAPNMSVGVNVLMRLLDLAARALPEDYDVEIIETHHRHKVDAPSGTALAMGEVVASARGQSLKDHAVFARQGVTGERPAGAIGFATVRGGDVVGDHTALFAGIGERIEVTHKSASRSTYAQGALRAARFLAERPSGLYSMNDVLGLA